MQLGINAGGGEYGELQADSHFSGGNAVQRPVVPISGVDDDAPYLSGRFGSSFAYTFDLPDGVYQVELSFAETGGFGPGVRPMNITANGQTIFAGLDVAATVGLNAALVKRFQLQVVGGSLVIGLVATGANNAFVNSIRISDYAPEYPDWLIPTGTPSKAAIRWTMEALAARTILKSEAVAALSMYAPTSVIAAQRVTEFLAGDATVESVSTEFGGVQ